MKTKEGCVVLLIGSSLAFGSFAADEKDKGKATPPPVPPQELAKLDIANSKDASIPGGATVVKGSWSVDAGAKKLLAAPEPLVDAWLEFGPEIREKGATITASVRGPGGDRLKSRFGVGLYGKNGFQLRLVPVRQEIELVRRGEVLLSRPFPHDPAEMQQIELAVRPERQHWVVSGRAWKEGGERPEQALLEYKIFAVELLFPLAGRSVLVATPFSGESVAFASAVVMPGPAK
ncbi:MAG: hypothetical protein JNJ70_22075 [Verrucomicrobiales bacterium]|nr:hypothetical protein [Verrucomicrobiales bacterium]